MLHLAREALQLFGYQVLVARDGLEALNEYEKHGDEIGAVVLDVIMPRLGGIATLQELHRLDPGVRVLLTSGYDYEWGSAEKEGVFAGCRILTKPYRIDELAAAIRSAAKS